MTKFKLNSLAMFPKQQRYNIYAQRCIHYPVCNRKLLLRTIPALDENKIMFLKSRRSLNAGLSEHRQC